MGFWGSERVRSRSRELFARGVADYDAEMAASNPDRARREKSPSLDPSLFGFGDLLASGALPGEGVSFSLSPPPSSGQPSSSVTRPLLDPDSWQTVFGDLVGQGSSGGMPSVSRGS